MNWLHSPVEWLHPPADWLHRTGDEASPLADEASPPSDEASPIGPYICFYFFLFSNVFFLSSAGVLPSESAFKTVFLKTFVDLLNYPFKKIFPYIKVQTRLVSGVKQSVKLSEV